MTGDLPIRSNGVSVYVCRTGVGRDCYLLLHRSGDADGRFWQGVSGSIEPGETAPEAVLRELVEETALRPESLYTTDQVELFYDMTKDRIYMAPIFVAFVAGDAEARLSPEHTEYRWVDADEAVRCMPYLTQKDALRRIDAEFVRGTPDERLRIPIGSDGKVPHD